MAMKNNERFVLSTFSNELEFFRPKRGRRQLMSALEHLNKKKPGGVTNFEQAFARYKKFITSRSYIAIVSDFLYPSEQVLWALQRYRKHEIRLVQVLDPMEMEFAMEGDFKFRDLETKENLRTFVNKWLRKSYLDKLGDHQTALRRACDAARGLFFTVPTNKPVFDTFWEIVQREQPAKRG